MPAGDIGAVIDTLTYATGGVYVNRLIHVSGDIFIVGDMAGANIKLFSFSIDSLGNIGAVIDTLVLVSVGGAVGGLVHISGDVFAVAYRKPSVVVETFTCDSSGNLGAAIIDSITIATAPVNGLFAPDLKHVFGNIYAVSYTDGATNPIKDRGWLKTITINNDGSIDEPVLDTYAWTPVDAVGLCPNILQVSATRYLQSGNYTIDGRYVWCFNITNAGIISEATVKQTVKIVTGNVGGTVHHVSGNIYAIFFAGAGTDGFLSTIVADFAVQPSLVDEWEFETNNATWPKAIDLGYNAAGTGKVFLVVYGQTGATGPQVSTIEVLKNGTITKAFIDQLTINASWAQYNDVVRVGPGIYAVSSRSGPSVDTGIITTFDVVEGTVAPPGMRGLNPSIPELMLH